jgi:hypothetical protein
MGGFSNAFFGFSAGLNNTSGASNVFIGDSAGQSITTEDHNTFLGSQADGAAGVSHSTVIGAGAKASFSNQIVLGTSAERTTIPGGLAVRGFTIMGSDAEVDGNLNVGTVDIQRPASGGTQACFDNSIPRNLGLCSSSLRYKKDVARFAGGLDIVNRLNPISFTWKKDGSRDIGLGAEEVARIDALLTFRNDKGEIEGVKYNQLSAVFITAIKEQQSQIKQQEEQLKAQQSEIEQLKRIVCATNSIAQICSQK